MSLPTLVEGERCLHDGRFEQAFAIFNRLLETDPTHAEAACDAGVAAVQLGRSDEAVRYFEQSLKASPGFAPAFYNLIDLLISTERFERAQEVFRRYEQAIPAGDDLEGYRRLLTGGTDEGMSLKIAFVCYRRDSFLVRLEEEMATRHTVRTLHFNYGTVNLADVQELMDWADVTWFEWFDELIIHASRKLKKTSRVVCRLHSFEVFTQLPAHVDWSFVDELVFVAPHIERIFHQRFASNVSCCVIPNGIDAAAFRFSEREPSFNLAFVGDINFKKNPELLLQCMAELVARDDRYVLHIAGRYQEPRYELYFEQLIPAMGLENNILYHGWVDDIDAWLEDKSYLVSTSVLESFGFNIAEAMAKGIKPLIHNWVGAEEMYPKKYLFNTVREFADMVLEGDVESAEYRSFVESKYSITRCARMTDEMFGRLVQAGASWDVEEKVLHNEHGTSRGLTVDLSKRGAAASNADSGRNTSPAAGIPAPGTGRQSKRSRGPAHSEPGGDGYAGAVRYWEQRYAEGGNSGAGSSGRLARFKADVVNRIVNENGYRSVIDFGCGDGRQLALAEYPTYVGLDVSSSAVRRCRASFAEDKTKQFVHYDPNRFDVGSLPYRADVALSMDVIFHLTEDDVYHRYMHHLFDAAEKCVIIYANDTNQTPPQMASHVRFRSFTAWIREHASDWELTGHIPNKYPAGAGDLSSTESSFSDFYVFEKQPSSSRRKRLPLLTLP